MRVSGRRLVVLLALVVLTGGGLAAALATGSYPVALAELPAALLQIDHPAHAVVWGLRLERALAAWSAGALLALAGLLMQTLLRNPLADPYLLGVSSGAAVGALAALLFGAAAVTVTGAAFAGAVTAMALVFALAHGSGPWSATRLILTGVIVASGGGAIVALMLTLAPEQRLHSMLFWLMGDAAHATLSPWPFAVLLTAVALLLPWGRDLNLLAYGPEKARSLGVPVVLIGWGLYGVASLLTATAVTLVGSVGFVGLIVPHAMRMLLGSDLRWLLPTTPLAGGLLLLVADTAARSLWAPLQLPVGVVTALLGVPFFLWLLTHARGYGVAR